MFGENFTAEWLPEDAVRVGDRFRVGSAVVMVTEPRLPCSNLAAKFRRQDIVKRFLTSGRTGFYLAVVEEGPVQAGDPIELVAQDPHGITVADITRLYVCEDADRELMRRAAEVPALPEEWREHFLERLAEPGS
jgi:MOSC domain-containing protein YiiM